MARLIDWIDEARNGEDVEVVVFGSNGWYDGDYDPVYGKLMNLAEAMPILSLEFHDGYGAPECHAMIAYTRTWAISLYQYDGSTGWFKIPRNPIDGFSPVMPGG